MCVSSVHLFFELRRAASGSGSATEGLLVDDKLLSISSFCNKSSLRPRGVGGGVAHMWPGPFGEVAE